MSKYQIEVEIPDGDYCSDWNKGVSCKYQGDAYCGAGCCALITEDDSVIHWDDESKPIMERKYIHIVKHKNCPSLL